jgi:hypothetical protein
MPRRLTAAQFIAVDRRVSPDDAKMLERDRLAATDTRTEAQRWLGDPPPWRSALAQRTAQDAGLKVERPTEEREKQLACVGRRVVQQLRRSPPARSKDEWNLEITQRQAKARELVSGGMSKRKAARLLGVSHNTITRDLGIP